MKWEGREWGLEGMGIGRYGHGDGDRDGYGDGIGRYGDGDGDGG